MLTPLSYAYQNSSKRDTSILDMIKIFVSLPLTTREEEDMEALETVLSSSKREMRKGAKNGFGDDFEKNIRKNAFR